MTAVYADDWLTVYGGDCRAVLRELPAESVHCVVTSPPYWGLRDYGTATWEGGDPGCDHRGAPKQSAASTLAGNGHGNGKPLSPSLQAQAEPVGRSCPKCGAHRIDSQLGLEATPEEYVAALVDVFREVRRVLRADGTVWLNLGDSYAGGPSHAGDGMAALGERYPGGGRKAAGIEKPDRRAPSGLKPKDLVGIPWLVARALQQPYYTGTIRDERDRIWLAAMLDAEGCLFIHKRKTGQSNGQGYYRTHDNYGPGVEISNTSLPVIERIMALVGKGSISTQGPDQNARRKQTIYRWNLRTTECREFVRELYPHLVAKQQQARILIGCPPSGERAEAAHAALMALHRTGVSDVDFPAPESMYERGWFLRSDIVWSKCRPNPMPESVTDRPTKSHEYLFLLSKSARYFFDADAVREPHGSAMERWRQEHGRLEGQGPKALEGRASDNGTANRRGMGDPAGRNLRSVWTIATAPYPGAHFATFPPKLVEPCVKAGCPPDGVVLDIFAGTGTVGLVAAALSRRAILIDLNPDYLKQCLERNRQTPLGLPA